MGRGTGVAGANIYGDARLLELSEPRRLSLGGGYDGPGKDALVPELTSWDHSAGGYWFKGM
jgi:hypothetical protein